MSLIRRAIVIKSPTEPKLSPKSIAGFNRWLTELQVLRFPIDQVEGIEAGDLRRRIEGEKME
jgi:hypothetical protein